MSRSDKKRSQGKAANRGSKSENSAVAYSVTVYDSLLVFGFIQIITEEAVVWTVFCHSD